MLLKELLVALDYLYTEAAVTTRFSLPPNRSLADVSQNIQSKNIMMSTNRPSLFEEWKMQALRDIGNWRGMAEIPDVSFEESELYLEGGQNKDMFIQFVRKMVAWDPDERQTARELLTDPRLAS